MLQKPRINYRATNHLLELGWTPNLRCNGNACRHHKGAYSLEGCGPSGSNRVKGVVAHAAGPAQNQTKANNPLLRQHETIRSHILWKDKHLLMHDKLCKEIKNYTQYAGSSLESMITEYLQEESELLPTAIEVDNFSNSVDELRLATDRLQAHINARIYNHADN